MHVLFVLYKPIGDDQIKVSLFSHNGSDHRSVYSESPQGALFLTWDYEEYTCKVQFRDKAVSSVDLRRRTLDSLFFP